jgi:hypothetical protein
VEKTECFVVVALPFFHLTGVTVGGPPTCADFRTPFRSFFGSVLETGPPNELRVFAGTVEIIVTMLVSSSQVRCYCDGVVVGFLAWRLGGHSVVAHLKNHAVLLYLGALSSATLAGSGRMRACIQGWPFF